MFCASIAEVISIGAVLPFLTILTMPEKLFEQSWMNSYIQVYGLTSPQELLLPLTIVFCVTAIFAGIIRLSLLWVSMKLSYAIGADFSYEIYRKTLYQPYEIQLLRNSSDVIAGIILKTNSVISYVITPSVTLINSSIMLIAILIALILIDPIIALETFSGLSLIYIFISLISRYRIRQNSNLVSQASTKIIKMLQEGLGGIRDVLLGGTQEDYCRQYQAADRKLRRAQGNTTFLIGSPRYAMEALGMVLIAVMAYKFSQEGGIVIPVLGALALGAQRLLPAVQQAYAAWTSIKSEQASLFDILSLLDQPLPNYIYGSEAEIIDFHKSINLHNISYRYESAGPLILSDVNLVILKGSRIGIVGKTGSGKSTLLDLVIGLLTPTNGVITIDGQPINDLNRRAWQKRIANVSQKIFLADSTIAENIAFGVPKKYIDYERVVYAAKQAKISTLIASWPSGYNTVVGERGSRLSGGQQQRIGIARALYKNVDVLVFDEATSALDEETEKEVMQSIHHLNKEITILIISHRESTLIGCDQVIDILDGKISLVNC